MTLQNHLNQKYNRQFEKLSRNCLNKRTRSCIQQDPAKVKFYGTAKIYKLPVNGGINELLIQQIVSNLTTATYNLAKYLSKLLPHLR